jgi:hypothetical protein
MGNRTPLQPTQRHDFSGEYVLDRRRVRSAQLLLGASTVEPCKSSTKGHTFVDSDFSGRVVVVLLV